VVGGEHAVYVGIAVFDPVDNLFLTCHAAAQKDLLTGVAALGVG